MIGPIIAVPVVAIVVAAWLFGAGVRRWWQWRQVRMAHERQRIELRRMRGRRS